MTTKSENLSQFFCFRALPTARWELLTLCDRVMNRRAPWTIAIAREHVRALAFRVELFALLMPRGTIVNVRSFESDASGHCAPRGGAALRPHNRVR